MEDQGQALIPEERLLFRMRWIGIASAILYPAWRWVYYYITPDAYDSFWERMVLAGLFATVAILTLSSQKKYKEAAKKFFVYSLYLTTLHLA